MLATLPVWLARPNADYGPLDDGPGRRLEWDAGPAWAAANADRYFDLVCLARLAGVGWSLLGGWVVYRWATDLYGGAGLLSLGLWCIEPNLRAHAQLVTPDLPATVAGLAACYVFWRYLKRPSWPGAWFAGLLLGLALLTKFTWFLLFGLWPALALMYWWAGRGGNEPRAAAVQRACQAAFILGLGLLTLNVGYGFQGTGRPLGDFPFVSRSLAGAPTEGEPASGGGRAGNRFRGGWLGRIPVPLPADCVLGVDLQRRDFEAEWPSYLGGEWQRGGRWYFYLYALAVKVPFGVLALTLGGLLLCLVRHRCGACWRDEAMVWLPAAAILTLVSSQTGLNYLRYALPLFPFALIGAGRFACFLRPERWRGCLLVTALLAWAAGSSLAVHPHELSYFNEAAGGAGGGGDCLLDANLDWGQDLLFLKSWLDDHPEARPLGLAYFNHVDPRIAGIPFQLPPPRPEPGWYAVSVHFVRGGSFAAPDGAGAWRTVPPHRYEYFRRLQPIARAGPTLWIYHVTQADADEARRPLKSGSG